jgi:hypothetical protein
MARPAGGRHPANAGEEEEEEEGVLENLFLGPRYG